MTYFSKKVSWEREWVPSRWLLKMAEVTMFLLHWKVVAPFDHYVNQLKSANIWLKIRSKLTYHQRKIKHLWPVKISDSSFSMWILFFIPWKSCQRWCIALLKCFFHIRMIEVIVRNLKKPWKLSKPYHILQQCIGPKLQLRLNLHPLINEKWKRKKNKGSLW